MLVGVPQWFARHAFTYSGGVGSTNEVDVFNLQGRDKGSGPYTETVATHTVVGGPSNFGPVLITVNDAVFALPFNQVCSAPDYVWNAMVKTTDANPGGQWTWS